MPPQGYDASSDSEATAPPPAGQRRQPPADRRDLVGRVALVTGATSGLGMEAAAQLAERGATVIFGVRNTAKAERVAQAIRSRYADPSALDLVLPPSGVPPLDLSSPASIAAFASALLSDTATPLHILINNAGTSMVAGPAVTERGVNSLAQVNYLGAYQLTRLLEPKLVASRARLVAVSSVTHRCYEVPADPRVFLHSTSDMTYPWTKLANVLFAYELQRRLGPLGVQSCVVDPGGVRTSIWDEVPALAVPPAKWVIEALYAPPSDGAEVLVAAATRPWEQDRPPHVLSPSADLRFYARGAFASPALTLVDGAWRHWLGFVKPSLYGAAVIAHSLSDYPVRHWSGGRLFNRTMAVRSAPQTYDTALAAALWDYSAKLCGLAAADLPPPPLPAEAAAHVMGVGGGGGEGFSFPTPAPPGVAAADGADSGYESPQATPTRKRAVMSPMQTQGFVQPTRPPLPTAYANTHAAVPQQPSGPPGPPGPETAAAPQPDGASAGTPTTHAAPGAGGATEGTGGGGGGRSGSASRRRLVVSHARGRDSDTEEGGGAAEAEAGSGGHWATAAPTPAVGAAAMQHHAAAPSPPVAVPVPPPPQSLQNLAAEHGIVLPGPDATATTDGGAAATAPLLPTGVSGVGIGVCPPAPLMEPVPTFDETALSRQDSQPPPHKRPHTEAREELQPEAPAAAAARAAAPAAALGAVARPPTAEPSGEHEAEVPIGGGGGGGGGCGAPAAGLGAPKDTGAAVAELQPLELQHDAGVSPRAAAAPPLPSGRGGSTSGGTVTAKKAAAAMPAAASESATGAVASGSGSQAQAGGSKSGEGGSQKGGGGKGKGKSKGRRH